MAKLSGFVEKQKDGKFWAVVDMPSNEPQDIEHPSTFGYTEDVGPFDTEAEAQALLDTGFMSSPKPKKAMTVGELMKQLEKFPPEMEIEAWTSLPHEDNLRLMVVTRTYKKGKRCRIGVVKA
jgi:hypothetical protein